MRIGSIIRQVGGEQSHHKEICDVTVPSSRVRYCGTQVSDDNMFTTQQNLPCDYSRTLEQVSNESFIPKKEKLLCDYAMCTWGISSLLHAKQSKKRKAKKTPVQHSLPQVLPFPV
jgi:hypothetical protein